MQIRFNRPGAAVVAAAVIAGMVIAAPASAKSTDSLSVQEMKTISAAELVASQGSEDGTFSVSMNPGTYRDAAGAVRTYAYTPRWECTLKTNNPHYSIKNGGVIAKATVSCKGEAGTLPINVYMVLGRTTTNSISTLKIVKESQYTQHVQANGGAMTWYVPRDPLPGAIRGAYFRASSIAAPMPPLLSFDIAPHASQFIYVT